MPVEPGPLKIIWSTAGDQPAAKSSGDRRRLTTAACKLLGQSLVAGNGPWGLGAFPAFGCYAGSRLVTGKAVADSPWELNVTSSGAGLTMQLRWLPGAASAPTSGAEDQGLVVAKLSLKQARLKLMQDQTYVRLLAATLLDQSPFAAVFTPVGQNGAPPLADVTSAAASPVDRRLPEGPSGLTLFTLSFDPEAKVLRAVVRGQATKRPGDAGRTIWHLEPGNETWTGPVYGQRPSGPKHASAALLQALNGRASALLQGHGELAADKGGKEDEGDKDDKNGSLIDGLGTAVGRAALDQVASGYIGLRYGREQVDRSTAVFPPAELYGLIAEFRGGVAKGLRFYYDTVPPKKKAVDGNDHIYIGFSRAVAGYGFGFSLPTSAFSTRLEAAPKIGVWSVDARLPRPDPDEGFVIETLKTHQALSLGAELSAELAWRRLIGRFWVARDTSSTAFGKKLASDVTSDRLGIDLFIQGPELSFFGAGIHLSFLAFAMSENITLHGVEGQGSDDGGAERYSLIHDTAYAGGGLSLSW